VDRTGHKIEPGSCPPYIRRATQDFCSFVAQSRELRHPQKVQSQLLCIPQFPAKTTLLELFVEQGWVSPPVVISVSSLSNVIGREEAETKLHETTYVQR